MAWTRPQQLMFFRACTDAGMNDRQRYMVMTHAGCKAKKTAGRRGNVTERPSASHPDNTQKQFECCMAMVEAHAADVGVKIAKPKHKRSWHEAALGGTSSRLTARVDEIMRELERKIPDYNWDAQLRKLVSTNHAAAVRKGCIPAPAWPIESFGDLDATTMLNVLRGLENVGRKELNKRGHTADYLRRGRRAS